MYALNLVLHSLTRWLVLALCLAVVVRSSYALRARAPFTEADERLASALVAAVNVQFLLGSLLWLVTSPLPPLALAQGLASDLTLAFFGALHPTAMIIAVGVVHVGLGRLRRVIEPRARHRSWLTAVASAMLIVLVAIPWPALWSFGRPLWRDLP